MNRFVIVINNRQASTVALGPRVGKVQQMIKTIDRTPKRISYPGLRQAMLEAPQLAEDLKESPGATVTLPDKSVMALQAWIDKCATDPVPPEVPIIELGAADEEGITVETIVVDPDAPPVPPAPAPKPATPTPAAKPAAPTPTPAPEQPKQDAQAK